MSKVWENIFGHIHVESILSTVICFKLKGTLMQIWKSLNMFGRIHVKILPWKFRIKPNKSRANLYVCKQTFYISRGVNFSESKRCDNVIPLVHCFYLKTKVLADFQISISVTLSIVLCNYACLFPKREVAAV